MNLLQKSEVKEGVISVILFRLLRLLTDDTVDFLGDHGILKIKN